MISFGVPFSYAFTQLFLQQNNSKQQKKTPGSPQIVGQTVPLDIAVSFEILDPVLSKKKLGSKLNVLYNLVIVKMSVVNMF